MTIRLIIKGNRFDAAKAASARNIPLVFKRETTTETIGITGAAFYACITAWFLEDIGQAPFPCGSLLHYAELE